LPVRGATTAASDVGIMRAYTTLALKELMTHSLVRIKINVINRTAFKT